MRILDASAPARIFGPAAELTPPVEYPIPRFSVSTLLD